MTDNDTTSNFAMTPEHKRMLSPFSPQYTTTALDRGNSVRTIWDLDLGCVPHELPAQHSPSITHLLRLTLVLDQIPISHSIARNGNSTRGLLYSSWAIPIPLSCKYVAKSCDLKWTLGTGIRLTCERFTGRATGFYFQICLHLRTTRSNTLCTRAC